MGTPLKTTIAASIRSLILTGEMPAGSRIKEEEIAKKYGVSRGPIRAIFIELSMEGLMKSAPYKGLTVRELPTPAARKIYVKTRREIEALALTKGYVLWSTGDKKAFEKILIGMRISAEMEDLQEYVQGDMNFHRFIIEQYKADDLLPVWTPLVATMALPYSRHNSLMESYEEHIAIVDTLKNGNLKEATALLIKHIK